MPAHQSVSKVRTVSTAGALGQALDDEDIAGCVDAHGALGRKIVEQLGQRRRGLKAQDCTDTVACLGRPSSVTTSRRPAPTTAAGNKAYPLASRTRATLLVAMRFQNEQNVALGIGRPDVGVMIPCTRIDDVSVQNISRLTLAAVATGVLSK